MNGNRCGLLASRNQPVVTVWDKLKWNKERGPPKTIFELKTLNVSSWGTAAALLPQLADSSVDVLLIQEHKLLPPSIGDTVSRLRHQGWHFQIRPAKRGNTEHTASSGVAVGVRGGREGMLRYIMLYIATNPDSNMTIYLTMRISKKLETN